MYHVPMTINGEAITAGQSFDVINPATGEVFAQCPEATGNHVNDAVHAAKKAFTDWRALSIEQRSNMLVELANVLEQHMPELMELVTQETGKPLDGLNGVGSAMEVGGAMAWTRYTSSLTLPIDVVQDNEQGRVEVHRVPVGVVASVTPWNWPLMIAIWHIMPALLAGNTVVLKPSPMAPVATMQFVKLANAALPPGVLNVISGGKAIGEALTTHPQVAKVIFTGSTAAGISIMQGAAPTLKRLTLELGGNDAAIVLPDVDIEETAEKLFGASFHNNGQTCACIKRLYVHESIYDELAQAIAKRAQHTVVGDGLQKGVELGPVQNAEQFAKVTGMLERAIADGASVLSGGAPSQSKGYFLPPTVLVNVKDGDEIVDKEQFGPVLPIIKYSNIDDVIDTANQNPAGLGASVWSADKQRAKQLAMRLEAGTVWVNEHGAVQPDAPFGGVKQSGVGVEFGPYGLAEYVNLKTIKVAN